MIFPSKFKYDFCATILYFDTHIFVRILYYETLYFASLYYGTLHYIQTCIMERCIIICKLVLWNTLTALYCASLYYGTFYYGTRDARDKITHPSCKILCSIIQNSYGNVCTKIQCCNTKIVVKFWREYHFIQKGLFKLAFLLFYIYS